MENNKIIKYVSLRTPFKNILVLVFILLFFFNSLYLNTNIDREILVLSLAFILYLLWCTLFAGNYRISKFVLKNKKLNMQIHRGLKIKNISIDMENIQKFQVDVNVDYKRIFIGIFEITTQIVLNNGQQYEMKNCTKQRKLFETLTQVVKEIPVAKIFINSNIEKGLYSQESLYYYLEHGEQSYNSANSTTYICFIIIFVFIILSFITMLFQQF